MDEHMQKQIREVWEWCGFTDLRVSSHGVDGVDPSGKFVVLTPDLNNLFKHAIPKLEKDSYITLETVYPKFMVWSARFAEVGGREYEGQGKTPALALLRAIWEAMKLAKEKQR